MRETTALHRVLSDICQPDHVRVFFERVVDQLTVGWSRCIGRLDAVSTEGQLQLRRDIQYMLQSIGKLERVDTPSDTAIMSAFNSRFGPGGKPQSKPPPPKASAGAKAAEPSKAGPRLSGFAKNIKQASQAKLTQIQTAVQKSGSSSRASPGVSGGK